MEYNEDFPKPPDYQEKTEYAFARLMYPDSGLRGFGFPARRRRPGAKDTHGGRRIIRGPPGTSRRRFGD